MPHVLILDAPYYEHISKELLAGAVAVLEGAEVTHDYIAVPGVLEIAPALSMVLEGAEDGGREYDGFITLGCVIRGETTHYDIVAFESARALMELAVGECLALGNGIQTVENEEQALRRAKASELDKGGHAAKACLDMIAIRKNYIA